MKRTTVVLAALAILCPAAKAQLLGPPRAQGVPDGGADEMGGIGIYHASSACDGCTTKWTRLGGNVGAGVQFGLGGTEAFCEVRGHYIASPVDPTPAGLNTGTWFVPVSFGVKF
jgi:hypothetical protein